MPNGYGKFKVAAPERRTMDGRVFASKMEMDRYKELKLELRQRGIYELKLQPRFELFPAFKNHKAIVYVADFMYWNLATGKHVVEEVKGYETDVYKIKAHLFELKYPEYEYKVTK